MFWATLMKKGYLNDGIIVVICAYPNMNFIMSIAC